MNRALILGALALLVGCGGDDRPNNMKPVKPLGSGGRNGIAGAAGASAAGQGGKSTGTSTSGGSVGTTSATTGAFDGAGMAGSSGIAGFAGTSALAPIVVITSPAPVQDPNQGALKLSTGNDSINVSCSVTPAGNISPINISSVAIELEQGGKRTASTLSGDAPDFKASFAASLFDTGWVTLHCSASALNAATEIGTSGVTTYVDKGPVITIIEPVASSAHAATQTLKISARIAAPATIDPLDTQSGIQAVSVKVGGATIPTCPAVSAADGTYSCEASLNDKSFWGNNLPSGTVKVEITASNLRGTSRTQSTEFLVDQLPPNIVITSPLDEQIVNETGKIYFTVSDADSAISLKDVRVKIQSRTAGTPIEYRYATPAERWECEPKTPDSAKTYDCWFEYLRADVQYYLSDVLVEVDAADTAGNDTRTLGSTQNVDLYLDRIGPHVHLDPPMVRYLWESSDKLHCSNPFDPVGYLAASDRDPVGIGLFFRALVYDTAQIPDDNSFAIMRPALPDPDSVYVYIQRDPKVPLLIHRATDMGIYNNEENHPPYCNAINEAASNTVIRLDAVTPWGGPPETTGNLLGDPAASVNCEAGTATSWPDPQCDGPPDLSFVLSHEVSKDSPVIYARRPTNNEDDGCTGDSYQLPLDAQAGWFCAVAIARDRARGVAETDQGGADNSKGNLGVSPPIRLCFQGSSPTSCDQNAIPSCTQDCTVYDPFSDAPVPYKYMVNMSRYFTAPN